MVSEDVAMLTGVTEKVATPGRAQSVTPMGNRNNEVQLRAMLYVGSYAQEHLHDLKVIDGPGAREI